MRKRFFGFFGVLWMVCACSFLNGMPLTIVSVMERYYPARSFIRISEFFTGVEDTGGDTVLRTDECGREGIYLVVGLNRFVSQLGDNACLRFRYILCDSNVEREKTFILAQGCGWSPWIFVGITGADFHRGTQLVAWSLDITTNQERVVKNSFLWSMNECDVQNCERPRACVVPSEGKVFSDMFY